MSSGRQQSFYEIQLNNGSLIAAFLVAVALGVAVFMLGVMVGRGQAPATPEQESGWVEEDLGTADVEDATEPSDPEFFEKVQESESPVGEATAEPATADQEPPSEQAPAETPQPQVSGLPEADPSLASGYVIQVKSTPERADADRLQGSLAAAGFPAFVIAADVNGRTTYRVRVGRYRTSEDATAVERALSERSDVESTWVTTG